MNLKETKNIKIFINMYVHYQEIYNAYTISNSFNNYFMECKFLNFINHPECYVMINSAPHCEEELIKIEITLSQKYYQWKEKEEDIINFKKFVSEYFNNQIKVIEFEFID